MVDLLAASDVEEDAPSSPEQQPTPKQRLHCGAAGRRAPKRPWSAGPAECIIDLTCPDADGQAERDGEAARRCASLADGAHAEGTADAAVPRVKRTVHLQSAQLACSVDQQQQPLLPLQDAVCRTRQRSFPDRNEVAGQSPSAPRPKSARPWQCAAVVRRQLRPDGQERRN